MIDLDSALQRLLTLGGCSPERRWLDCGTPLHVLLHGRGDPLLLLHGGGGGAGNWYRLFARLGTAARLIAPDLPGFGHSPAVMPQVPLGIQAARLLVRLLDTLGIERANLLGTSFGGLAALRLAQHFPGRVRRMVLLDSAGLAPAAPRLLWWATRPLVARWALRPSARGTRWQLRHLLASMRLPVEHELALVAYLLASARAHEASFRQALGAFLDGGAQREWLSARELSAIGKPALLLWGGRDRFFDVEQAHAAVRALPRARLRVIADAGHSPNWERPDQVAQEVVEFLLEDRTESGWRMSRDAQEDHR